MEKLKNAISGVMTDDMAANILSKRAKGLDRVLDAVEIEAIARAVTALTGDDSLMAEKREKSAERALIERVIEYFNVTCGTSYKANTKSTQSCISARIHDGFIEQDFKDVINFKCAQWKGNKDMEQYLRPKTLFGTKFESYLISARKNAPKPEFAVCDTEEAEEAEEELSDDEWMKMILNEAD